MDSGAAWQRLAKKKDCSLRLLCSDRVHVNCRSQKCMKRYRRRSCAVSLVAGPQVWPGRSHQIHCTPTIPPSHHDDQIRPRLHRRPAHSAARTRLRHWQRQQAPRSAGHPRVLGAVAHEPRPRPTRAPGHHRGYHTRQSPACGGRGVSPPATTIRGSMPDWSRSVAP